MAAPITHPPPPVTASTPAPQAPAPPIPVGETRVAVVGTGYIADYHLQVLKRTPDVEVVCVADPDRARAEAAARRHGVGAVVEDLEELRARDVQIAHLCVPPDQHAPVARALLELGIGVFAEKPLCPSAAEARELVELAEQRSLTLGVNHNNVYDPTFVRLMQRVQAGAIGRVEHVQVTLSVPLRQLDAGDYSHWMFAAPRNVLLEQGIHPFSQLERLLGPIAQARSTILSTRELHPGQVFHERWVIAARAERGTAELYLSFGAPFTKSSLRVLGTDGCLEADLQRGLLSQERKTRWLDFWDAYLTSVRRGRALVRDGRRALLGWLGYTLGVSRRRDPFFVGMRDSIQSFHAALRRGERPPNDAQRALAVLGWCEAATGEWVGEAPASPEIPEPGPARPGEVVLTGATGFIGRRLVRRLLERGTPVTAVVRRRDGLPVEVLEPALDGRLRIFVTDLEDYDELASALQGASACVHLATGGGDDWQTVERWMVGGARRVGELCAEQGARMVFVSSVAALYAGADAGVAEIGDEYPTDPQPESRALYARGKIAAEQALRELERTRNLRLVVARPGVVLGEGTPLQHGGLGLWVRDNHCVGWGRGDGPLPLVWVEDVAEALARAAVHEGDGLDGKAMNLGSRVPLAASDVVRHLARRTERDLHFHARPLWLSQAAEVGKWVVKLIGRRRAPFPSYRDLKSRELAPALRCETAREVLGWVPLEEREAFLERVLGEHGPRAEK